MRTPHTPAPLAEASSRPGPLWMRALAACIARLPWRWLPALGAVLGAIVGGVLRIRRRQVAGAMRDAGIAADPRGVYASLGTGLCELLWLAGRPPQAIDGCFELAPGTAARFEQAAAAGRGLIVATAHVGNWDLTACATARWRASVHQRPVVLHVITKRLSWRALDGYWQHLRASRGVALIDTRGAYAAARQALAEGGAVAMLVDQVPERASGVATFPFLGAAARHDLAPATLAARACAPIVVALSHRRPDGTHLIEIVDVLEPPAPQRDELVRATRRIAESVERFVRAHPEQWLWLHRRWKSPHHPTLQPTADVRLAAGADPSRSRA